MRVLALFTHSHRIEKRSVIGTIITSSDKHLRIKAFMLFFANRIASIQISSFIG